MYIFTCDLVRKYGVKDFALFFLLFSTHWMLLSSIVSELWVGLTRRSAPENDVLWAETRGNLFPCLLTSSPSSHHVDLLVTRHRLPTMAKSRPAKKDKKNKQNGSQDLTVEMAGPLFEQATELLQEGQANEALPVAQKLIQCLSSPAVDSTLKLPALDLIGEIYIELGEAEQARNIFLEAVKLDPDGTLGNEVSGGADKFLWLAQLCDEGGQESVDWFEKGAAVLRRELQQYDGKTMTDEDEFIQEIKRTKLANALCGAAEVYMTDLRYVAMRQDTRWERLARDTMLIFVVITAGMMMQNNVQRPW